VAAYGSERLAGDPLSLVRPYGDPRDREVAGLVVAGLAFGSAKVVIRSGRAVLEVLGSSPARGIRDARRLRRLRGFRHRWVSGEDVAGVLGGVAGVLRSHGSLEALFLEGFGVGDPDVGPALGRFARALRAGAATRGARYLLPDPSTGGAAKRLCLFLRWMARPDDGLDLGVWSGVPASALVMPLDTHVLRIARYIGLTTRRTASFATAREITRSLARLDPEDPTRYDFAIAQLGISRGCVHRREPDRCDVCPLTSLCTLRRG
jgi:uncharacterized protein (TIGR02757 family)